MNREELFNAITNLRDEQIEEAQPRLGLRTRRARRFWIPAAAALVLTVALVVQAVHSVPRPLYTGNLQLAAASYPLRARAGEVGETAEGLYEGRKEAAEEAYGQLASFWNQSAAQFLEGSQDRLMSPVNLYLYLGMAAEMTQGSCRNQLLDLVGCGTIEELRESAGWLWESCYQQEETGGRMLLANSIWLDNDTGFHQETLDLLAEHYYADSFRGEMGSESYSAMLWDWLDEKNGEALVHPEMEENDTLTLASALTFQADWERPFAPEETTQGIFYTQAGEEKHCDFMNQRSIGSYYTGQGFDAAEKPLTGGSTVLFVRPEEGTGLDQLLASQDYRAFLESYLGQGAGASGTGWKNTSQACLRLSVPKWDGEESMDYMEGLRELGATEMFERAKGRFQPLTEETVAFRSLAETYHVRMDEWGCNAQAGQGNGVGASRESALPENLREVDFTLNRPFLFVVVSSKGTPVYMGGIRQMDAS